MQTHHEFERLAIQFLEGHPTLHFEWRRIDDIAGGRTDLLVSPGSRAEVFATLRQDQITVGNLKQAVDFESFGRAISDSELAAEALEHLQRLITEAAQC